MKPLVIVIPGIHILSTLNLREHWSKRHRRMTLHKQCGFDVLAAVVKAKLVADRYKVRIVAITPKGRMDSDNLAGGCKGVRDGIALALRIDDGSDRFEWSYGQRRGPWSVEIEIEGVA